MKNENNSASNVLDVFSQQPVINELIVKKIADVRSFIADIVAETSMFNLRLNNFGNINGENAITSGEIKLFEAYRSSMNKVVTRCYDIYRSFINISEIMLYFDENKSFNLSASYINLSDVITDIIKNCSEYLKNSEYAIIPHIEKDIHVITNKTRFQNLFLAVIQNILEENPRVRKVDVKLSQDEEDNVKLLISTEHQQLIQPERKTKTKSAEKNGIDLAALEQALSIGGIGNLKLPEIPIDSVQHLTELYCNSFDCSYEKTKNQRPIKSISDRIETEKAAKRGRPRTTPVKPSRCVIMENTFTLTIPSNSMRNADITFNLHSPSADLQDLLRKDRFSNVYVALSGVVKKNFF